MADIQLDTSGVVYVNGVAHTWEGSRSPVYSVGLSPFVQGYVEALLGACWRREYGIAAANDRCFGWKVAFSDLASETLARLIEDCAKREAQHTPCITRSIVGKLFWTHRQHNVLGPEFPPLTVSLNNDGKVVFQ